MDESMISNEQIPGPGDYENWDGDDRDVTFADYDNAIPKLICHWCGGDGEVDRDGFGEMAKCEACDGDGFIYASTESDWDDDDDSDDDDDWDYDGWSEDEQWYRLDLLYEDVLPMVGYVYREITVDDIPF